MTDTWQITATGRIMIDYADVGLSVVQTREGTVVYTPESKITGQKYLEHKMPHKRYSLAWDEPASGNPGSAQFEADVRQLLARAARTD